MNVRNSVINAINYTSPILANTGLTVAHTLVKAGVLTGIELSLSALIWGRPVCALGFSGNVVWCTGMALSSKIYNYIREKNVLPFLNENIKVDEPHVLETERQIVVMAGGALAVNLYAHLASETAYRIDPFALTFFNTFSATVLCIQVGQKLINKLRASNPINKSASAPN